MRRLELECDGGRGVLRRLLRAAALLLLLAQANGASAASWEPAEPQGEKWDWVQLDTREWLKGELLVLINDEAEFDSDKFNEVAIDLEDIVQLRLAKPRIFRRDGRRTYPGVGRIENGRVYVVTPEGPVEFPVKELVSIVYTNESELNNWVVRVGVSLDSRSGNTDQQDFSGNALVRRDGPFVRWTNRYLGVMTRVDDEKTAENHRASTDLDFLFTQHFFLRAPSIEFYKDEFQNIALRLTPGVSLGYEPIDTKTTQLIFTLGGAMQYTEFEEEGGSSVNGAALFTTELEFDFPRDVDLDFFYGLQLVPADLGSTSHETRVVLSYEFYDPFELDLGFYWDRIESPERESDGSTPERDDFRFTVGIALDF